MDVDVGGLIVSGGSLIWIVTTNKGWAHLRGLTLDVIGHPARPFRADLFSAASVGDHGVDRIALRLYDPGADPNLASPTHKVRGWLEAGSVRFGRRHRAGGLGS